MIQLSKKVGVVRQCFQAGPPVLNCKSLVAHTLEGNAKRNTSAFVEVSISHPSSHSTLIGSEMTVLAWVLPARRFLHRLGRSVCGQVDRGHESSKAGARRCNVARYVTGRLVSIKTQLSIGRSS
jgi:hypothetical protein